MTGLWLWRQGMKSRYTKHALERMIERSFSIEEIEVAVVNGTIIREYPDDKPYPSFLLLHKNKQKTLHVVFSITEDTLGIQTSHIITIYEPDILDWNENFTERRDKQ
jgi:hypothetical protein